MKEMLEIMIKNLVASPEQVQITEDQKENVIQFKREGKIITMKVHFTCIEDITKE